MTPSPEHAIINIIINNKDIYNKYYKYISIDNKELKEILLTLEYLYTSSEKQPTFEDLHVAYLARHPGLSKDERATVDMMFSAIADSQASQEQIVSLLSSLRRKQQLNELALLAYDCATTGKGWEKVLTQVNDLEREPEIEPEQIPFVTDDLEELYVSQVKEPGLRWRLPSLNHALGSLRAGDFGVVFARPEVGKTTFLASEVTFMAEQCQGGENILWANNEEQGGKVKLRIYQAALGIPLERLISDRATAQREYLRLTHGAVKLLDEANLTKPQIERACHQLKPRLVLIDQIDKVKGFDSDRDDLKLGAIYQWARELAKTMKCPVIGICQADGTAEGQKWLHMGHMANAKTAKQAEADWILGIGRTNDVGFEYVRHFNISKNKLIGDEDSRPEMRHGRWDVLIKPEIARYGDILNG